MGGLRQKDRAIHTCEPHISGAALAGPEALFLDESTHGATRPLPQAPRPWKESLGVWKSPGVFTHCAETLMMLWVNFIKKKKFASDLSLPGALHHVGFKHAVSG